MNVVIQTRGKQCALASVAVWHSDEWHIAHYYAFMHRSRVWLGAAGTSNRNERGINPDPMPLLKVRRILHWLHLQSSSLLSHNSVINNYLNCSSVECRNAGKMEQKEKNYYRLEMGDERNQRKNNSKTLFISGIKCQHFYSILSLSQSLFSGSHSPIDLISGSWMAWRAKHWLKQSQINQFKQILGISVFHREIRRWADVLCSLCALYLSARTGSRNRNNR